MLVGYAEFDRMLFLAYTYQQLLVSVLSKPWIKPQNVRLYLCERIIYRGLSRCKNRFYCESI